MATPIGKLSAATFPVVMAPPRVRLEEARGHADRGATPPQDANLVLLEVAAGQVSESTGEPCDVNPSAAPGEADPLYRMELMGFIVGSLSRAAQAARAPAPETEEPKEEEEDVQAEEETQAEEVSLPEVALPEGALPEAPVGDAAEAGAPAEESGAPAGYGQDGHVRTDAKAEETLRRWA